MIRIDNIAIATKDDDRKESYINWAAVGCVIVTVIFWAMIFWWVTE